MQTALTMTFRRTVTDADVAAAADCIRDLLDPHTVFVDVTAVRGPREWDVLVLTATSAQRLARIVAVASQDPSTVWPDGLNGFGHIVDLYPMTPSAGGVAIYSPHDGDLVATAPKG